MFNFSMRDVRWGGGFQPGNLLVPLLTSLLINILGLMVPLILLQVYNRIIPNQAGTTLSLLVAGVMAALLVEAGLRILRTYYIGWLGARFEHRMSCDVFRRLLFAEPGALEKVDGAKHMERMNAIQTVGELFSGQILLALFDIPFLFFYLFLIWRLGGGLILVPLVALAFIAMVSLYVGKNLKGTLARDLDLTQRRYSFITETLSRIHSVKSLAMEGLMLRRYEMLQTANLVQTHNIIRLGNILPAVSSLASQCTTALVMGLGAVAVMHGELTAGGLAACTMLAGRTLQPMQTLVSVWTRLQSIRLAQGEVEQLLTIPQRPEWDTMGEGETISGALSIRGVGFSHGERVVLADLDLDVAPGECIGIVGESGGGKTTLLKLLAGKLPPTVGEITADGQRLIDMPVARIQQIAYVPQRGSLFNGTILQNLTMFDDDRREAALRVAEKLGLDGMVARMPKGYHTLVGDGATDAIPAGMIQRIAIARILSLEPRVLLFDEANMAIDSAGDSLLRVTLEELKGSCTIILISQRPSLLRMADRSFHLRDGCLRPVAHFMEALNAAAPQLPAGEAPLLTPEMMVEFGEEELRESTPWPNYLDHLPFQNTYLHCLRGLLEGLAWKGTSRQLAEAVPHLFDTLDLTGLCNTMTNLKFTYRLDRGELHHVDDRLLPFLFVSDQGVALVAVGKREDGRFEVIYGESGERGVSGDLGPGQAFFFSPPGTETPRVQSWVRTQLNRFRPLIWTVMTITLISNAMATATPLFTMMVYDRIIPSGSEGMGLALLLGTLLAILVDFLMRRQRVRIMAYMGAKAERLLSSGILDRLLALPASYTEQVTVGAQVARIKSLEVIREMFIGPLAHLYYDAPTTLFFLMVLFIISPGVLVYMLMLIAALGVMGVVLTPLLRQRSALASRWLGQRHAFLTEALARVPIIHDGHAGAIWFERYRHISGKATLSAFQLNLMTSFLTIFSQVITMAASVGVMALTARGVMAGELTMGAVVASMMLTWRIFAPIQTTFLGVTKMVQVFGSMTQIDRLMEIKGEREAGAIAPVGRRFEGAVAFSRVSFRYRSDAEPALVGVSFRVPAGAVVAVIGANGSGKSTLLKMILGLYTPQAGSVMIDNGDIRQTDPLELRQSVSYLPQNCDIFFGTVAQNLRLVNPVASDEELTAATARAGLLEEIRRMPEGFDTRLRESQSEQLSTGFKQRLSLARAYLKRSSIMLFDEPGNNLDAESERLFREAVALLRGDTTLFIVTHRPSHLKLADVVLYMEGGYLRAAGTPEEVARVLPKGFV